MLGMVFVLMGDGSRESGEASRDGREVSGMGLSYRGYEVSTCLVIFRVQVSGYSAASQVSGYLPCQVSGYPGCPSFSPFSSIFCSLLYSLHALSLHYLFYLLLFLFQSPTPSTSPKKNQKIHRARTLSNSGSDLRLSLRLWRGVY